MSRKKLLRQSQGQDWWGNPDRLLSLWVLSLWGLQSLTPTERQEEGKCKRLGVWDRVPIMKTAVKRVQ